MIKYIEGDIFLTNAQAIAHGCNCKGLMGAGIAVRIKNEHPDMFNDYKNLFSRGLLIPGRVFIYTMYSPWIINMLTQLNIGRTAKLEYIGNCFDYILNIHENIRLQSIAMPMIGCGYGGLDRTELVDLIRKKFINSLEIELYVKYVPDKKPLCI